MKTTNLGMPNTYGLLVKKALEAYLHGKTGEGSEDTVRAALLTVREYNAAVQSELDLRPVFDECVFDRLLETSLRFGFVPERFRTEYELGSLDCLLAIARGTPAASPSPAARWFNTHYFCVRPEIDRMPELARPFEAGAGSPHAKAALIGPATLLNYAVIADEIDKRELEAALFAEYARLINGLPAETTVQLEEPGFLPGGVPEGYGSFLSSLERDIHLHVYYGPVTGFAERLFDLPARGLGLDFIDGPSNLEILSRFPKDKTLIAGVLDARSVYPPTTRTRDILDAIASAGIAGDRLYISPSAPLDLLPLSAADEPDGSPFSFAIEKLSELASIKEGRIDYARETPGRGIPKMDYHRTVPAFSRFGRPFAAAVADSLPFTSQHRRKHRALRRNEITQERFDKFIRESIDDAVEYQEETGLDVISTGEFERPDDLVYFAEKLDGFKLLESPVRTFGTRTTRLPAVTGDIRRRDAFSVEWVKYAQSRTDRPVAAKLPGPASLALSVFRRADISLFPHMYHIAIALGEEIAALANEGISFILLDEPFLAELAPLDPELRADFDEHAANCFRLATCRAPAQAVTILYAGGKGIDANIDWLADFEADILGIDIKAGAIDAQALSRLKGFPSALMLCVSGEDGAAADSGELSRNTAAELVAAGVEPERIALAAGRRLKRATIAEGAALLKVLCETADTLRDRFRKEEGDSSCRRPGFSRSDI